MARHGARAAALLAVAAAAAASPAYRCLWLEDYTCAAAPPGAPATFATEAACAAACRPPSPAPDAVARWLHDQVVALPPLALNTSLGPVSAALTCTHLGVGYFKSNRSDPAAGRPWYGIDATLYGISAACGGTYEATIEGVHFGPGAVQLAVGGGTYYGGSVRLTGSPPTAVVLTCGDGRVNVTELSFADPAMNKRSTLIKGLIEFALPGVVCPVLPSLSQTKLSPLVAELSAKLQGYTPAPPTPAPPTPPDALDLHKSPWVRLVEWVAVAILAEPSPPANPGINWLLGKLTRGTGALELAPNLTLPDLKIPFLGGSALSVTVDNVRVWNLTSVESLSLLTAAAGDPTALRSSGVLRRLQALVGVTVRAVAAPVDEAPADITMMEDSEQAAVGSGAGQRMAFSLDAEQLSYALGLAVAVKAEESKGLGLFQLLDISHCLLPVVSSAQLTRLHLNASLRDMTIASGSISGVDQFLRDVILMLRDAYGHVGVSALDALLDGTVSTLVNALLDAALAGAHAKNETCGAGIPDPLSADDNDFESIKPSTGGALAGYAILCCFGFLGIGAGARAVVVWRHRRSGATAPLPPSLCELRAPRPRVYWASLALHVAIPVLLMVCVGLRVFSLSAAICKVHLKMYDALSGTLMLDELAIAFSFKELISDFFKAGAWLVSVLIIGGSAVSPCVTLVGMLVMWWVPCDSNRRGKVLFLLNHSTKLSFIDVYFIALMTHLFRADLLLQNPLRTGEPVAIAKLLPDPVMGIFGGMTGVGLGKIMTAVLLYLHRDIHPAPREEARRNLPAGIQQDDQDAADEASEDESDDGVDQSLITLATSKGGGHHVRLCSTATPLRAKVAAALLFVTSVTLIISMAAPLMDFNTDGVIGWTQEQGGPSQKTRFHFFTIPSHLYDDTRMKAGAVYIILLYVLLLMAVPIVCTILWGLTWFVPLPMRWHRMVGGWAEHLFAWHGIDIMWVTLFAGWFEMNSIAEFLIDDTAGSLSLGNISIDVSQKSKDYFGESIMEVHGTWRWGSWPLLVCAITAALLFNLTYEQESVRQHLCNEERHRLRLLREEGKVAQGKDAPGRRAGAALGAYDDDDRISESARSTAAARVATQYCVVQ